MISLCLVFQLRLYAVLFSVQFIAHSAMLNVVVLLMCCTLPWLCNGIGPKVTTITTDSWLLCLYFVSFRLNVKNHSKLRLTVFYKVQIVTDCTDFRNILSRIWSIFRVILYCKTTLNNFFKSSSNGDVVKHLQFYQIFQK